MTVAWVQKGADGPACKQWHLCTQSVQSHSHKPWKVREVSVMIFSTMPKQT